MTTSDDTAPENSVSTTTLSTDHHNFGLFTDYANWNLGLLWIVGDVSNEIVQLYQRGRINEEVAHRALAKLVVTNTSGQQWALGSSSKRWYKRFPKGDWRVAETEPEEPDAWTVPCREAILRTLNFLGVDSSKVELENREEALRLRLSASPLHASNTGSLLEDLLGEEEYYG